MTPGRVHRLCVLIVDQALLKPGENVLEVVCSMDGVTIPAKLRVGNDGTVAGIDTASEMIAVTH